LRHELLHIRKAEYAKSLGERNPGLGSLSAPILGYQGALLGSFSLAMPEIRFGDPDYQNFCIRNLLEITREFSKTMGFKNESSLQESPNE